ncbi:MAG: P-loop ATPase [Candidatus Nanohalarchaeota archaeon]|nr:MAG: P-loop ATPase [Candidatus Nanohaloarchaeota archaeon]
MKQITILSGKGGVGKSSITASLAIALSKKRKIVCADCDVDASNLALVFGMNTDDFKMWESISTNQKARVDLSKCISCRKCASECYFNAIDWDDAKKIPVFREFGCEGCGVCEMICPSKAIELYDVSNARIGYGKTKYGFVVVSGQLEMGESGSGKVVSRVKELALNVSGHADVMLVDAAAGIGCTVIASVAGSDYVIGVCEPTPSGFSDLKRALSVVNHFNIHYGIVINKYDMNPEYTRKIEEFAKKKGIRVLSKIGYDKCFMDALVNLVPVIEFSPPYKEIFDGIVRALEDESVFNR